MKYLYQQLLAFAGVILLMVITLGFSFTQFTRQTLEQDNYNQLARYAEAVDQMSRKLSEESQFSSLTDDEQFLAALSLTEQTLDQEGVSLVFYDTNGKIKYPLSSSTISDKLISSKQWQALKNGESQKMTTENNEYGESQTTSYAMVSFNKKGSGFYGVLVISQPATNVENSINAIRSNLFKGFIIASILAIIVSYFFATRQLKRIKSIRSATDEIAKGNFDIQIPDHGKDEFDDLASDFNSMTESLKESNEEIERQEERRRQFMADASHEMRTPLTTINGLLEGLQYDAIPEDQKAKAISLMQNETARLIRLVNENLDYEKIRTNQISIIIKKFDATETLSTLVTQLEQKAAAAGDQLILETQEPVTIYADYDRFVQVMVNIMQNAIQFTEDGEIRVSVFKKDKQTIVKIADTGIGMNEEQVKNIWDRYYKVDPSRKNTKYGESGLGLSIVQELVRLHNGTVDVESTLNEGTTFTISFPDEEINND
ncbi:ATP-binding protein [Enterococcus sp. AZ103]|uniref:ATP-binding protein n=1 Tax=Enterococcus sp. AZ103 TaxID=2774628 RepID=UPI003F27F7CF